MADFDINQHLQRMGFGQSDPKAQDAPPKNFDELIEKILNQFMTVVGKFAGVKTDTMLNTGILPQNLEKAGIQVNNSPQSIIPDAQGGVLYKTLADGLQVASVRDFSKVSGSGSGSEGGSSSSSAPIESASSGSSFLDLAGPQGSQGSFDWKHMSDGALGGLTPMNTGSGAARGEGMGLA